MRLTDFPSVAIGPLYPSSINQLMESSYSIGTPLESHAAKFRSIIGSSVLFDLHFCVFRLILWFHKGAETGLLLCDRPPSSEG